MIFDKRMKKKEFVLSGQFTLQKYMKLYQQDPEGFNGTENTILYTL